MRTSHLRPPLFAALSALLAVGTTGCNGAFTGDLSSEPPVDPAIAEVNTTLLGLEFEKDGGSHNLEFTDGETVDLLELASGTPMRVFTDEKLPTGNYTGVRLLFADRPDLTVVDTAGKEVTGTIKAGEFTPVSFSVEDRKRTRESLTLTLDLRRSLVFDETSNGYVLTPVLRAVPTDNAAQISGAVANLCPPGTSLAEHGAVYVFEGRDLVPDDLDGTEPEPYATSRIATDSGNGNLSYDVRFLPSGNYTVAVTCAGDEDQLGVNDNLDFRSATSVSLVDGESATVDLN